MRRFRPFDRDIERRIVEGLLHACVGDARNMAELIENLVRDLAIAVEIGAGDLDIDGRGNAPLAACEYDDGRGHPLAFARDMFGDLSNLHGDKGVWKLMDRYADKVADVPVAGPVPRDVDTWEDYEAVLAS